MCLEIKPTSFGRSVQDTIEGFDRSHLRQLTHSIANGRYLGLGRSLYFLYRVILKVDPSTTITMKNSCVDDIGGMSQSSPTAMFKEIGTFETLTEHGFDPSLPIPASGLPCCVGLA